MFPNSRHGGPKAAQGFTLLEVLIATVLGALVLLVVYQVLIFSQRSFTVQAEQIRQRQTLRAALHVLGGPLRDASRAGDVLGGSADSIALRQTRGYGIVCGGQSGAVVIEPTGRSFVAGDSVLVFVDGDPYVPDDDTWVESAVVDADAAVCPTGEPAQTLVLAGMAFGAPVAIGAPVRATERRNYRLGQFLDDWFLMRSGPGGMEPLVGPLADPTGPGLAFVYLDSLGTPVADARDADQIEVTLRTTSPIPGPNGIPLADSVQARFALRN